jgi:Icc-related predicted phosphoesterase
VETLAIGERLPAVRWAEDRDGEAIHLLERSGCEQHLLGALCMFEVDDVIRQSKHVELVEGKVTQLDDQHEMISAGWSTPTPWNTHREEPEDQLRQRIQAMIDQLKDVKNSVFNLHNPPYGSGLDEAPELTKDMRPAYAGRSLVPVGSHAVLELIEKYQPLLTLHGHIHEGKGTRKFKRTLCINPGSMYEQGMLLNDRRAEGNKV